MTGARRTGLAALCLALWVAMVLLIRMAPAGYGALAFLPAVALVLIMARPLYALLADALMAGGELVGLVLFVVALLLGAVAGAPAFAFWQLFRRD